MNFSEPFIDRPVATTLLTIGVALAGAAAFFLLPVSPLPQVDFPTISVQASMPGASPETMATSVATPLERHLGQIANVTEMTSGSSVGATRVTLQFGLDRDIDGAARDVQAAINAARADLPTSLRSNPTYKKVNPADAPIMILALNSQTLSPGQLYDSAATVLQQKLSQVEGIGQVNVGGGSLSAVRVELNPHALFKYGVGLEDVRASLASANANSPKGAIEDGDRHYQIYTNDQARHADDYRPLVVAFRNGAAVRLGDVGEVVDSVEDLRNLGLANGRPAVLVILYRQPGANIIETVDRVAALLPELRASIPADIDLSVAMDRTSTIRGSLRDVRATLIPSVAVPVSLIGTFGVKYLLHYSLDNLSLMALTIATGFVVDDAIVVLENVVRHIEGGMPRMKATLLGTREVGFTVLSMSVSLVAVFIPILLMGGIVGRLFREFAVTLSVAILVSLVVSLTTTPMMCSRLLQHRPASERSKFHHAGERWFARLLAGYESTLASALRHPRLVLLTLLATVCLNVTLFVVVPKGFFPQQDTGRLVGGVQADQSISFQSMRGKMIDFVRIVKSDPAVETVVGFTGGGAGPGGQTNSGFVFVALKSLSERGVGADRIIGRLRKKLATVAGASLFLQAVQDIRVGGRQSNAQYQYTLQADHIADLQNWTPKLTEALRHVPELADVNSDQQDKGLEIDLAIDRASASSAASVASDTARNQAMNQLANTGRDSASTGAAVSTAAEKMVPLSAFSHFGPGSTPLAVNHQGHFAASTISFNLPPDRPLSDAVAVIRKTMDRIGVPAGIHGSFQGTAKAFQESLDNQPILILAALGAVYIVLGILYESYVHPITILSTLPSAGVGAVLALMAFDTEFTVIALIGVILLIGIVKKNAIMMIDFALDAERHQGMNSRDAIFQACLLRFRPIMMTTMVALLGALPLAFGGGDGAELRRPLGISIAGGLIVSQVLTLYTTPVVYLTLDRLRLWSMRRRLPMKERS